MQDVQLSLVACSHLQQDRVDQVDQLETQVNLLRWVDNACMQHDCTREMVQEGVLRDSVIQFIRWDESSLFLCIQDADH